MPMKKRSLVKNSYIFKPILILSTLLSSADPIKHQEFIVDETWAIFKYSINFHRKMPMKKRVARKKFLHFWTDFDFVTTVTKYL